jgi:hypothetical protein
MSLFQREIELIFGIWCRFCPQGIPSGRNRDDILHEIRKEAFNLRRAKSAGGAADEDEEEEAEEVAEGTLPVLTEEWEQWFPQEWIGWVVWGVPSESPTEHWVNQPTSEGPTDTETFITDKNGKRISKKPPGRSHQRERESSESTETKTTSNNNTMMSHRLIQVDQELQIANSSHNLRIIELLRMNATTQEEITVADEYYKEFLLHEGDLLKKRLAIQKATREKEAATTSTNNNTTPMPFVARCTPLVLSTANHMPENPTPDEENENFGESTKSLYSFEYVLFIV